jgi:hypothetical protein
MLSLHRREPLKGLRPIIFNPRTLAQTWSIRPEGGDSFVYLQINGLSKCELQRTL